MTSRRLRNYHGRVPFLKYRALHAPTRPEPMVMIAANVLHSKLDGANSVTCGANRWVASNAPVPVKQPRWKPSTNRPTYLMKVLVNCG